MSKNSNVFNDIQQSVNIPQLETLRGLAAEHATTIEEISKREESNNKILSAGHLELKNLIEKLQIRLEEKDRQTEILAENLKRAEEKIVQLESVVTQVDPTKIRKSDDRLRTLEEQVLLEIPSPILDTLRLHTSGLHDNNSKLDLYKNKIEEEIDSLRNTINDLKSNINSIDNKKPNKSDMDDIERQHDAKYRDVVKNQQNLDRTVNDIQSKQDAEKQELDKLLKQIDKLQTLHDKYQYMEAQLENWNIEKNRLNEKVDTVLTKRLSELGKEVEQQEKKMLYKSDLVSKINELKIDLQGKFDKLEEDEDMHHKKGLTVMQELGVKVDDVKAKLQELVASDAEMKKVTKELKACDQTMLQNFANISNEIDQLSAAARNQKKPAPAPALDSDMILPLKNSLDGAINDISQLRNDQLRMKDLIAQQESNMNLNHGKNMTQVEHMKSDLDSQVSHMNGKMNNAIEKTDKEIKRLSELTDQLNNGKANKSDLMGISNEEQFNDLRKELDQRMVLLATDCRAAIEHTIGDNEHKFKVLQEWIKLLRQGNLKKSAADPASKELPAIGITKCLTCSRAAPSIDPSLSHGSGYFRLNTQSLHVGEEDDYRLNRRGPSGNLVSKAAADKHTDGYLRGQRDLETAKKSFGDYSLGGTDHNFDLELPMVKTSTPEVDFTREERHRPNSASLLKRGPVK